MNTQLQDVDLKQFNSTPQNIPTGITQYFLPPALTFAESLRYWKTQQPVTIDVLRVEHQMLYQPVLFAQAQIHVARPKLNISHQQRYAFEVADLPVSGAVQWDKWRTSPYDPAKILAKPYFSALYLQPSEAMTNMQLLKSLRSPFLEYVHGLGRVRVPTLPNLKMIGKPGEPMDHFKNRALQYASYQRDSELNQLHRSYRDKIDNIESEYHRVSSKIEAEHADEDDSSLLGWGETLMHFLRGEWMHGMFDFLSTTKDSNQPDPAEIMKTAEAEESQAEIERVYEQYYEEADLINDKWASLTTNFEDAVIVPSRDEVIIESFGLGWQPHYYTQINNERLLLPAQIARTR